MKQTTGIKKYFILVTEVILQVIFLIPWICMADKSYSGITYIIRIFSSGDAFAAMKQDFSGIMDLSYYEDNALNALLLASLAQFIVLVFAQLICLLNLVFTIFGREVTAFNIVPLVSVFVGLFTKLLGIVSFDNVFSNIYPVIPLLVLGVEFIGVRVIEGWQKANKENMELKARDAALKAERKRRLAFPGKYTSLFYQIIWKNFKYSKKDYIILISAGVLTASLFLAGIGTAKILAPLDGDGDLLRGFGVVAILRNFLLIILAVSVFFMVSVLLSYFKKRMKNYGIFINLGMRKKTLYLSMIAEIAVCMVMSVLGGYLLGTGFLFLIRAGLKANTVIGSQTGNVSASSYLTTFLFVLLTFTLSLVIIHEMYMGVELAKAKDRAIEKEKMPGKHKNPALAIGAVITILAVFGFSKRSNAEGISFLCLLFLGVFLLIRNGWAILLEKRKNKSGKYYPALIKNNIFYYRFKTTLRYVFFIGVVHVALLFQFSKELASNTIAKQPERLFPYDYMCMATDKDEETFKNLKNKYGVTVYSYPMVRVSNPDNTEIPDSYRTPPPVQGQHIGISESTYYRLCSEAGVNAEKLDLPEDGSEVYLVYQQDINMKGHPIDYYLGRTKPHLHIGQPVDVVLNTVDEDYPQRSVNGEKIGSLTGAYRWGQYENVIVFSDKYFASVQDIWKTTDYKYGSPVKEGEGIEGVNIHQWPTRLVLLNVAEGQREAVEAELETFKKSHAFDEHIDNEVLSYYSSEKQITQMRAERIMNMQINAVIIAGLLVFGLFIVYLKFESEIEEKKRRSEFLLCMGMKREERIRVLKSETKAFLWIPLVMAGILVPLLTVLMWRIRQYTLSLCFSYLKVLLMIAVIYLIIQIGGMKLIEFYVIRKVEGKRHK